MTRPPTEAEDKAERIAQRLDTPVTLLGFVAVLFWLLGPLTNAGWFDAMDGIVLWGVVAIATVELVARLIAVQDTFDFVRGHWWEVLLLVPMLRPLRAGRAFRALRVLLSGVRSVRAANLEQRLLSLALVTALIAVTSGRLLFEHGGYPHGAYGTAMHDAILATVSSEPLPKPTFWSDSIEIVLAIYHAVVVATLAAAFGAFFLEGRSDENVGRAGALAAGSEPDG